MSLVNISNVAVGNNPAPFNSPFAFDITFECISQLQDDLEFKIIYVGSANSSAYDQELESILVGPVPVGINRFTLEAPAPDLSKIPAEDVLGVTVLLLTCSYKGNDFIRVGYYVNNEYTDEELQENPPAAVIVDKLVRNLLAEKPRVTRIPIDWDKPAEMPSTGSDLSSMAMDMMQEAASVAAAAATGSSAPAAALPLQPTQAPQAPMRYAWMNEAAADPHLAKQSAFTEM